MRIEASGSKLFQIHRESIYNPQIGANHGESLEWSRKSQRPFISMDGLWLTNYLAIKSLKEALNTSFDWDFSLLSFFLESSEVWDRDAQMDFCVSFPHFKLRVWAQTEHRRKYLPGRYEVGGSNKAPKSLHVSTVGIQNKLNRNVIAVWNWNSGRMCRGWTYEPNQFIHSEWHKCVQASVWRRLNQTATGPLINDIDCRSEINVTYGGLF